MARHIIPHIHIMIIVQVSIIAVMVVLLSFDCKHIIAPLTYFVNRLIVI